MKKRLRKKKAAQAAYKKSAALAAKVYQNPKPTKSQIRGASAAASAQFRSAGISKPIQKIYGLDAAADLTDRQKKSYRLRSKKYAYIQSLYPHHGTISHSLLDKSYRQIDAYFGNAAVKFPNTLYVGYVGLYDGFEMLSHNDMSIEQLKNAIRQYYYLSGTSGSGEFKGVFQMYYAPSAAEVNRYARAYSKRGYNLDRRYHKFEQDSYNVVTVANTFTEREYLSLVYNVISQSKYEMIEDQLRQFADYAAQGGVDWLADLY